MKKLTIDLLNNVIPYGTVESEMIQRTIAFINSHDNPMNQKLEVGHLTGSSWIVNRERTKALFTHHTKLGMWLQLGGHAEKSDATIRHAAIREAQEESGLQSIKLLNDQVLSIDVHLIPERKGFPAHHHYDIQFLFEADEGESLSVSAESKDLKWIAFDDVSKYNEELSIRRMLEKAKKWF